MKLSLARKPQCRPSVERIPGNSFNLFDVNQSRSVNCRQLVVKHLPRFARWHKQITIEPFEFTFDCFLADDSFDFIDRRGMTLRGEPRTVFTVEALKLEIAVVESIDEMRRRSSSHASANRS